MKELNFTDRETYLAWREEWRAAYAKLSADIRSAKNAYKGEQRKVTYAIVNQGKSWEYIQPMIDDKPLRWDMDYYKIFGQWHKLRAEARSMLELRVKSKEKSAEQRLKAISPKTVDFIHI